MAKANNGVLAVCATVIGLAFVGATTYLSHTGGDATELSRLINTLLNFASVILSGGAFATAAAAATSAHNTEKQTNGQLKQNVSDAVAEAVAAHLSNLEKKGDDSNG